MTHHRNFHYVAEGSILVPAYVDTEDELTDPALLLKGRGWFEGGFKSEILIRRSLFWRAVGNPV